MEKRVVCALCRKQLKLQGWSATGVEPHVCDKKASEQPHETSRKLAVERVSDETRPTRTQEEQSIGDILYNYGFALVGSFNKSEEAYFKAHKKSLLDFIRENFISRKELEDHIKKYQCDFNWDFEADKERHKSYIAVSDILTLLNKGGDAE